MFCVSASTAYILCVQWQSCIRISAEDAFIVPCQLKVARLLNSLSTIFIFFGSNYADPDGDCSHEIKRCLLLGRKVMTNLDRDITLPTKVHLVKAMVFLAVMYGCESWTIKKAEYQRIDAFELWCWRRLLRIPWTTRRSNQSILKEISPEKIIGKTDAEAETPILWPPVAMHWLIGKDLDAGKDWRQEEKVMTEDEMVG